MKAQWKVEAYEDVTVPAGTFKAWRIVFTDNFGFKQTTWSLPETVGSMPSASTNARATRRAEPARR